MGAEGPSGASLSGAISPKWVGCMGGPGLYGEDDWLLSGESKDDKALKEIAYNSSASRKRCGVSLYCN